MSEGIECDKVWEKCARLLMLNPIHKLEELFDLVATIVENITLAPNVLKFRTLKYANMSINKKIVQLSGGLEFFHGTGFQTVSDEDGSKILRLQFAVDSDSDASEGLENLQIGVRWLKNTIETCRQCTTSGSPERVNCAECVIVVKLPTGTSVAGGFMRGDKLHHVRSYACCYFIQERASSVRLSLPESRVEVTEALLDCTLEELGLFPRAVVFATVHSEAQREAILSQKHEQQLHKQVSQVVQVKKEKSTKLDERQALKEERARILGAFKDDRSN